MRLIIKGFTIIFAVIILQSCCKAIINTNKIIKNNTTHNLTINHYQNGNIKETINLGRNSEFTYGAVQSVIDSTVLKWEKNYEVTYYLFPTNSLNPKSVQPNSSRSIYNDSTYERKVEKLKCGGSNTTLIFTFTEQDYLDAKK